MSAIEWTDRTWNPVRGCSRVSEGCRNCYAERMAARFAKPGEPFHGFAKVTAPSDDLDRVGGRRNGWTGRVELIYEKLSEPLRWRKPRRVFVNSMSDLFHEALPDEAIDRVFAVMLLSPRHTFQVLTKRPDRMRDYFAASDLYERVLRWAGVLRAVHPKRRLSSVGISNPATHPARWIWLGVSCEDQKTADERIPLLLQTPAAVRFVSLEPLLGPIDATGWLYRCDGDCLHPEEPHGEPILDWVIVGGESGPGARPCDVEWIGNIVSQCREAGVACFTKQWGARPFDGGRPYPLKNRKGGDPSEWGAGYWPREFPK